MPLIDPSGQLAKVLRMGKATAGKANHRPAERLTNRVRRGRHPPSPTPHRTAGQDCLGPPAPR